jgi:hypothetical protein
MKLRELYLVQIAELLPRGIRDYAVARSAQVSQMLLRAGIKPITDSIDESSFLHLFFLNCEKYREGNLLVKMLFDLRKLVCAK